MKPLALIRTPDGLYRLPSGGYTNSLDLAAEIFADILENYHKIKIEGVPVAEFFKNSPATPKKAANSGRRIVTRRKAPL